MIQKFKIPIESSEWHSTFFQVSQQPQESNIEGWDNWKEDWFESLSFELTKMALTPVQYAIIVAVLGFTSFVFGILAEVNKPKSGEAIIGKGVVICKYPYDPSIVLGYVSTAFLAIATAAGLHSLFYPYKGKSVPQTQILGTNLRISYFCIALATSVFAAVFLIWPTIQGQLHRTRNVHRDLHFDCPTAKTGLLGGGAFASLNASLFWLISLMLTTNLREDYFEEEEQREII